RGNVHPEELKRFHRFNNRTSYRYWLTVATIIMQKINPHQLALTRVQSLFCALNNRKTILFLMDWLYKDPSIFNLGISLFLNWESLVLDWDS
ncbi:MAG: hypothetical protein MI923_27215, partial [Phycisphaerales bacterium]|nr:hypothetical protein [Phycisphaerales bacterium]